MYNHQMSNFDTPSAASLEAQERGYVSDNARKALAILHATSYVKMNTKFSASFPATAPLQVLLVLLRFYWFY